MAIIATIPAGMTSVTVNGLHQWDYGQELEIRAENLPVMVEVHFACEGMKEAVVRSCAAVDGVITASIPDACLVQSTPVVAWVYEVGEASGRTLARVIIQIEPRTKPAVSPEPPTQEVGNLYTQAVAEMNAAVASAVVEMDSAVASAVVEMDSAVARIETGEVKAQKAAEADRAACVCSGNATVDADSITAPGLYAVYMIYEGNLCVSHILIPSNAPLGTYIYGTPVQVKSGSDFYSACARFALDAESAGKIDLMALEGELDDRDEIQAVYRVILLAENFD